MKTTTVKIDAARREELMTAAYEVSLNRKSVVSMSEVMKYLIDNYTATAVREMSEGKKEKA